MTKLEETKRFFDERAEHWDETCTHDPQKLDAIVALSDVRGKRVADIACGTGVLFPALFSHGAREVLGIDLSDRMIERAGQKYSGPSLHLFAGDLFSVEERGFEVATLYCAYPHFPDKEALFGKVYEMLVPGGRLMIAHSESKETINARHSGGKVEELSERLLPAKEEAGKLAPYFTVDILADTGEFYLISGLRK